MEPSEWEQKRREHRRAWTVAEAMAQERQFSARDHAQPAMESPAQTLLSLADLRDKGLLSDAEFEEAKQKLLGKM
jgi:hypothetical protein